MKCPHCEAANPADSCYCRLCGAPLQGPEATLPNVTRTISVPASEPRPGMILGRRYAIQGELGRGGMGIVYQAHDEKLGRSVALKILPHERLHVPEIKERFLLEARAAAALDHPNICTIFESGEMEGRPFITMAYIEGQDLKDILKQGPFDWGDAVDIAIQVGEGLEAAHRKGIVHRDIKSGNIRISPDDRAKIMDFGIARITGSSFLTQEGTTLGTAAYMSPEQARGIRVDHRTDIWSLGVTAYEMLTGRLPFRGESAQAMIYSVLNEVPAPMDGLDPEKAADIEKVVLKALAKDPGQRYGSAAEFVQDLRNLRAGKAIRARAIDREALENSVAVFDFANITRDPENDWLSGGIAETVTVDLKRVSSLKVIAREQVLRALGSRVGREVTEQQVINLGSSLGVRWVVWGGFQKLREALRITAHFTEAESGNLVGSAKVDGPMSDIFRLQDEIITRLMDSLQLEVSDTERKKIEAPETIEVEAYECYAKGRHLINQMGRSGMQRAMGLFKQAVEIDPDYALAYSGLGNLHTLKFISDSDPSDLEQGISYLQEAIKRDPELTDPYLWLGYGYTRREQFEEAIRAGQRAVGLEPDHPLAHYFLALAYHVRAATRFHASEYPKALDHYRINIRLQPNYQPAYMNAAWIYLLHGQYSAARRLLEKAVAIEESGEPGIVTFIGSLTLMGNLFLMQNRLDSAGEWYRRSLSLLEKTDHVYKHAFLALTYCGLGRIEISRREYDRALDLYKKAKGAVAAGPEGLGLGYMQVKALLGMAVTFHDLGLIRESKNSFREAEELLRTKQGYDFSWIWDGCDAQAYYDLAAHQALCRNTAKAMELLALARGCGWADLVRLDADTFFSSLRELPQFQSLREELEHRNSLPEHPDF